MKFYDVWGSDKTTPHMAVGWTWAFDTPFKWTKQVASHFGGTRQGMAISWPGHIKDVGGIRTQFHHIIDIVPTILEATGIQAPVMVNGIAQKPIEGVSMAYTFDKANANAPSRRTTQYFEMVGNRAIYHDGWIAATTPPEPPWLLGMGKFPDVVNGYKWELYNLAEDYSENNDLAAKMPDKLRDMQELFLVEATEIQRVPAGQQFLRCARWRRGRARPPAGPSSPTRVNRPACPSSDAPNIVDKSYTITAEVEIPDGRCRGNDQHARRPLRRLWPLPGQGQAGLHLRLSSTRNEFRWEGQEALAPGKHTIVFDFNTTAPASARAAPASCRWTARQSPARRCRYTIPFVVTIDESFDVGVDTRTRWTTTTTSCRSGSRASSTKLTVKLVRRRGRLRKRTCQEARADAAIARASD